MKIVLIGTYPPPYGGISVHIKRMKQYLGKSGAQVVIYSESKKEPASIKRIKTYKSFIFIIPFIRGDIFHFHTLNKKIRILLGFYKMLGKKIILTIHGESLNEQINGSNFLVRALLLKSLKKIDKIICVNPKNRNELLGLGFNQNKIVNIPSYIHPMEEKNDIDNIPKEIWSFMEKSDFLISANGCIRFYNNEDLYGFDMLVELISKLNYSNIEAKLLVCVLDVQGQCEEERNYYNKIKKSIEDLKLGEKIKFYEAENSEFYPILKKSKLFIRPTNTDGYGVSIAEAIYYKVPAIASDVCVRPQGTILFKARDKKSLYDKVTEVISRYDLYKDKVKKIKLQDNSFKILEVYKEVLINKR